MNNESSILKRFNWRLVLGVLLIGTGLITLFNSSRGWMDAGYELLLGVGLLIPVYTDRHPEQSRKPLAWVLVIIWGIALVVFTIIRSNAP